jgi:hypothetical protein
MYWLPEWSKQTEWWSRPHSENNSQQSVNNRQSCIPGTLIGVMLQSAIIDISAAFIVTRGREMLYAPALKWSPTEHEAFLATHHGLSQHDMAIIVYINYSDCICSLKGSCTLNDSFIDEISCTCHGSCRSNIPYLCAYIGCQHLVYTHL